MCFFYFSYIFCFKALRPCRRSVTIRGTFRSKCCRKPSQSIQNNPQNGVTMVPFWTILVPKCRPGPPKWTLRGPRRHQRVQRTAQELPSGDHSGPRDPPRVPSGLPMVPLGRLWAPFGLPWGGFGGLWMTFGDPLDTSGRHCGHFWCKAPEPSKTNEFFGKT